MGSRHSRRLVQQRQTRTALKAGALEQVKRLGCTCRPTIEVERPASRRHDYEVRVEHDAACLTSIHALRVATSGE